MSGRRSIVVGVVVTVVVAGGVLLTMRDRSTPLDAETVAASFRGTPGSAPGEPGVYAYTTDGYEAVDAFGGARHDYPATTFIVIEESDCGPTVRWQPLRERSTTWSHCGPDLAITSTVETHTWFGVDDVEDESCAIPVPVSDAVTDVTCVAGDTVETYAVEVIGIESVAVDGSEVEALRTRRTSEVSGSTIGSTVTEIWRLTGTPLIVRLELTSTNVTPTSIGDVTYRESVVLALDHLLPSS